MNTELIRFTQWAKDQPQKRFTALMGLLAAEEGLTESYHRQPSRKAAGVDGIDKAKYGRELTGNLADLSARLRRMGYRPKPSRRVYIPKSSGQGQRPIGIPCFEDRIVEDRLSHILQAIWEPELRECSYGFRPDRNAHQALARLEHIIVKERTLYFSSGSTVAVNVAASPGRTSMRGPPLGCPGPESCTVCEAIPMRKTQLGAGWTKSPRPVLRGRTAAPQRCSSPLLTHSFDFIDIPLR